MKLTLNSLWPSDTIWWLHRPGTLLTHHLRVILQEMLKTLIWVWKWRNFRSQPHIPGSNELTHWGQVTCICVCKLTISGSDNGLSTGNRRVIIWTNTGILLIRIIGTNFSEILSDTHTFSFKKLHLKMAPGKWLPFYLGLNVSTHLPLVTHICVNELSQHWFR